jgi:hypothetical protein
VARKLTDRDQTDKLIADIIGNARHHAHGMVGPARSIYDLMISMIDFGRDTVEVFERNGKLARTTWVTVSGTRMVFSYNYDRRCIVLKLNGSKGKELASFDWDEKKDQTVEKLSKALKDLGVSCKP